MKIEHGKRLDTADNVVDKTEKEYQKIIEQAEKILECLKR